MSFVYAFEGIWKTLVLERNIKIHFIIGAAVLVSAFFLKIEEKDFLWLCFAVFSVIGAEMVNTLIEKMMDLLFKEKSTAVKYVKDLAAGIVLWYAIFAATIGIIIFGRLLFNWSLLVGKIFSLISLLFFPLTVFIGVRKWKKK